MSTDEDTAAVPEVAVASAYSEGPLAGVVVYTRPPRDRGTVNTPNPLTLIERERGQFRTADLPARIRIWLKHELVRARLTRLEQKGREPIKLASVFVDIPVGDRPEAEGGDDLLAKLLLREPRPIAWCPGPDPNPERPGLLLIAGPGQGKSTVTQYLAQRHRAALLQAVRERLDDRERETLDELDAQPGAGPPLPDLAVPCLPVRVELPALAAWMQRPENAGDPSVEGYLRHLIAKANHADGADDPAAQPIAPEDLDALLKLVPWLFVFDGLDEVTAASEHARVVAAVLAFLEVLDQRETAAIIVATTRPQSYRDQLSARFESRHLLPLSQRRALDYASVLLSLFFADDEGHQAHVLEQLGHVYDDPETARMMTSPLQVSIMTELIDEIGQPPRQRWRLFKEYQGIIIARERKRKYAMEALREHLTYVEDILRHLGLVLQVLAETGGRADALVSGEELELLIAARLESERFSEATRRTMARSLRDVAVNRLVFLRELEAGRYGFELRPLQEFMAAAALTHGNEGAIEARLRAIAPSASWRNILLFAASKCFSSDGLYLREALVRVCRQLNEVERAPLSAVLRGGSAVALAILRDGSVQGPHFEEELAAVAVELLDVPACALHLELGAVGEAVDQLLEPVLTQRWPARLEDALAHWVVLAALCDREVEWAVEISKQRWPSEREPRLLIVTTVGQASGFANQWVLHRVNESADTIGPKDTLRFRGKYVPYLKTTLWTASIVARAAKVEGPAFTATSIDFWYRPEFGDRSAREQELRTMLGAAPLWRPYVAALDFSLDPTPQTLSAALTTIADSVELDDFDFWARYLPWPIATLLALADDTQHLRALATRVEAEEFGDRDSWEALEAQWRQRPVDLSSGGPWPVLVVFGVASLQSMANVLAYQLEPDAADAIVDPTRSRYERRLVSELRWARTRTRDRVTAEPQDRPNFEEIVEFINAQPRIRTVSGLGWLLRHGTAKDSVEFVLGLSDRFDYGVEDAANEEGLWLVGAIVEHLQNNPTDTRALHILATCSVSLSLEFPPEVLDSLPEYDDPEAHRDDLALRINTARTTEEALHHLATLLTEHADHPSLLEILPVSVKHLLEGDIFSTPTAQRALYDQLATWSRRDTIIDTFLTKLGDHPSQLADPTRWFEANLGAPAPSLLLPATPSSTVAHAPTSSSTSTLPRLESLAIDQLRIFTSLELALPRPTGDEGQWLVLLGENGVGKSTLLRAITLALVDTGVGQELVGNSVAPFLPRGVDKATITVATNSGPHERSIGRESGDTEKLFGPSNGPARPLVFAYGCARGSAASGEDSPPRYKLTDRVRTLFDDSARLTPAKTWLMSLYADSEAHGGDATAVYETVLATLETLLPGVAKIEVDGQGPWFSGPKVARDGEPVPLSSLSDGYITTVGWVIDLLARWVNLARARGETLEANFNEDMRGFVFVDEIDLHLHPRWQLEVIADIRKVFPRMNFVVTTHNPLTLLGARSGEIVVLRREADGEVHADQRDLPPGIRADQVLTGEWFGLVSTRDLETLELLEEHYRHLREDLAASHPRRVEVEEALRTRLADFPGTTLERLLRTQMARHLDSFGPLEGETLDEARRGLDDLITRHLGSSS